MDTAGTGPSRTGPRAEPPVELPPGRHVDLPGRGTTFVRDLAGPVGAPTLLLLHGWLATADLNWFPSYAALGRHFRVVALDHRGHGRGIKSARRFRLADCADDAAAVIDQLGLGPVIAVGYSMGGPIAQLLWHRHPRHVRGLVLCATGRNFRGRPTERAAFTMLAGATAVVRITPRRFWESFRERVAGSRFDADTPQGRWARDQFLRSDGRMLLEAGEALGRFSSHEWVHHVDVPSAIVLTERDQLVPPSRQHRLARAIPGATIHPVDGDHVVCSMDPDRFVPVLVDACREVASRRVAPATEIA